MWKEDFEELISEDIDILHEIKSNKVLCSRQAIVNFITNLIKEIRDEVVGEEEELSCNCSSCVSMSNGHAIKRQEVINKFKKYL